MNQKPHTTGSPSISLMTKVSLLVVTLITLITVNTPAQAIAKNAERWFEIEVMLIEQLGDKSKLKEQFPDNVSASTLPDYKRSFDLLSAHLQPNLTAIKQHVSLCTDEDALTAFERSLTKYSVELVNEMAFINQAQEFQQSYQQLYQQSRLAAEAEQAQHVTAALSDQIPDQIPAQIQETIAGSIAGQVVNVNKSVNENGIEQVVSGVPSDKLVTAERLPATKIAIDVLASEVHSNNELSSEVKQYHYQEQQLNSPLFSTKQLCVYTLTDFADILSAEQLSEFTLDSFAIEALPKKLYASGRHQAHSPYLISDDSLLLKDIRQRLAWSKSFRPLLHFGWRQVGITRKKAIPLKLFAGDHIQHNYQQQLVDYNQELTKAHQQEQLLLEAISASSIFAATESPEEQALIKEQQAAEYFSTNQQHALSQLFTELGAFEQANKLDLLLENTRENTLENTPKNASASEVLNDTIEQINSRTLEQLLAPKSLVDNNISQPLDMASPPVAPLQPWYLDGFFKVHLDHYLYITADFNVLTPPSNGSNTDKIKANGEETIAAMKLINFSQNRRVITGEIHYFDHPYVGMLVQIRRFDPSKSAEQAVSQAIK